MSLLRVPSSCFFVGARFGRRSLQKASLILQPAGPTVDPNNPRKG